MKKYLLLLCTLFCVLPASACWYGEKVKDGSDMVMIDILYPYWAESTYFACWNMNMYPKGGYFYAGVAGTIPNDNEKETYRPSTVWSFWPADAYEGRQVRNTYMNPEVYAQQYIGEGASGNAGGKNVSWILPKQWYTMCIKTWGANEEKKESFVGWWMKDKANNRWHLLATFKVPYAATGFTGNGGFLEDFGNAGRKQREIWHGAGYMRHDGVWEKCDTVEIDIAKETGMSYQGWNVQLQDHDSYLVMSHTGNKEFGRNLEPGQKHSFTIKQPEQPTLDPIKVEGRAMQQGNQLIVNWELDDHSSPQLGYQIEIYDNSECSGASLAGASEQLPQVRTKALSIAKAVPCWVKLTITDIFDQKKIVTMQAGSSRDLIKAVAARSLDKGLEYAYTETSNECKSLSEVDFSKAKQTGISRGLDTALRGQREDHFAFQYNGYLNVPESGAYTLVLKSCDGSRLKLGDHVVIDNDGVHSASDRRVGVFLQKGFIPFEMSYFRKDGGAQYTALWLGWEYAGKPLEEISERNLVRPRKPGIPSAKLTVGVSPGGGIQLKAETNAKNIKKIEYYNGIRNMASVEKPPYTASFTPYEGSNSVWARVYYSEHNTIDTQPVAIPGKSTLAKDWDYCRRSEPGLSFAHGYNARDNSFSFIGEGEFLINKPVKGDFEMVAKIKNISPDNIDVCPDDWVGLMVCAEKNLTNYDREIAIFQTVGRGLKCSADFSDLGTGRMALFNLESPRQWLKITRHGNRFVCYSSPDGKQWTRCLERIIPTQDEVFAGVTFRTIPGKGRGIFSAAIEDVKITPIKSELPKMTSVVPEGKVVGYSRLTPDLMAIRYRNGAALLEQQDGKYQQSAIKLPKGVTCARSMAGDGSNLYVAGKASGNAETDLYLSKDKGSTWEPLAPGLHINGDPEHMVAGEIIAINPQNPQEIMVASAKDGLYITRDGGKTWDNKDFKGEAISNVKYHPVIPGRICVLTADRESNMGKFYQSRDNGENWEKRCEVPSTGFLNVGFDTRGDDMFYLFSTEGIYTSFNTCHSLNRCLHVVPHDKTYLAVDIRRKDLSYVVTAPFDGSGMYSSDREWLDWKLMSEDKNWGQVFDITIADDNLDHLTMFAGKGVFVSEDAGKSWKQVFAVK